jgi:hypothetical protein
MSDHSPLLHDARPRRRDVFAPSRAELSPLRPRTRVKEPRVDFQGRFIGMYDVERGAAHFWSAQHRRGSSPIARGDPVFRDDASLRRGAPAGQARELRVPGLTLENLRALHLRHRAGVSVAQLARESGLGYQALHYHLSGSASLAAALRQSPVAA